MERENDNITNDPPLGGRLRKWDTASAWNPIGIPGAADTAGIGGLSSETIVIESPNAVAGVILNDPNAVVAIGAVAGAKLAVGGTLALEEGSFGVGPLGTLEATHIRIAAPKGSHGPTNGTLFFPGSATIDATVDNNGTIKAEGNASSELQLQKGVTGKGTVDISGGGEVAADTVFQQAVSFGAGGGSLLLDEPGLQSGNISGFAHGDSIILHGTWAFDALTNPTAGTTDLTLLSGKGATHTFDFGSAFSESSFSISSASGGTTIKLA